MPNEGFRAKAVHAHVLRSMHMIPMTCCRGNQTSMFSQSRCCNDALQAVATKKCPPCRICQGNNFKLVVVIPFLLAKFFIANNMSLMACKRSLWLPNAMMMLYVDISCRFSPHGALDELSRPGVVNPTQSNSQKRMGMAGSQLRYTGRETQNHAVLQEVSCHRNTGCTELPFCLSFCPF